jgi:hypothetical protein
VEKYILFTLREKKEKKREKEGKWESKNTRKAKGS